MTSTPTPTIRITVAVSPEVHTAFKRLSKAGGMSLSRAVGEWLADTVEAAEFMATKMEQARAAPGVVMRELQALALGTADELGTYMQHLRKKGVEERRGHAQRGRSALPDPIPPSSNTGGKVQKAKPSPRGSKS